YQTKFKGDKSYNYQLGQTKLRYGLIENKLEARVSSAGVTVNELDSGFSNMSLGAKIRLCDESKYIPSTEIITDWEIPVGDRDLRNVGFDQSYMLLMGKMFTKKFGSIINATVDFSSFNANTGTSAIVSAPLVFNLNYYIKPELNIFSHIYGTVYFTEGIDNPLAMDMGASYAITKDLVIVSWISKGLNDAAPDMTLDLGLIYRI
ncbi:MAG: transporter, partial [bacterium]